MAIKCCFGCVAPKRNPYCHSSCPEYIAEKEAHDKRKAEYDREQSITEAILLDRKNKVYKALKGLKTRKY